MAFIGERDRATIAQIFEDSLDEPHRDALDGEAGGFHQSLSVPSSNSSSGVGSSRPGGILPTR